MPGADIPAQRLVRKIKQMSLGKINIVHYAAGELVPAFEVFDAVREKKLTVHIQHLYIGYQNIKPFLFCCIPGGMSSKEIFVWLSQGNGQNLWDELYDSFNLISFPAGDTGTTMGGWFKKKLKVQ